MSQLEGRRQSKQTDFLASNNPSQLRNTYSNQSTAKKDNHFVEFSSQNSKNTNPLQPQTKLLKNTSFKEEKFGRVSSYKVQSTFELRKILKEKSQQSSLLRVSVNQKKKKIKDIQGHVDRQVMKTITNKIRQPHNVNIREIFSKSTLLQKPNKSMKVAALQKEREEYWRQIKEQKDLIHRLEQEINGPNIVQNRHQASELIQITRQKEGRIQQLLKEKNVLTTELQRIRRYLPQNYAESMHEEDIKLKQTISQLTKEINSKRQSTHQLQNEDRIAMEKTKFLQEVIEVLNGRSKERQQQLMRKRKELQETIKNMGKEILQMNDERIKVQDERESLLKSVCKEHQQQLKCKNQREKQLRSIESYFMELSMLKRANQRKVENLLQRRQQYSLKQEKQAKIKKDHSLYMHTSFRVQKKSLHTENLTLITQVDKEQSKTKKNSSEIGIDYESSQDTITNDQFLGDNMCLVNISFKHDDKFIYGIKAQYHSQTDGKIQGYNMASKIYPKDVKTQLFELGKDDRLSSYTIRRDENFLVKYLKIESSQGKTFEWGSIDHSQNAEERKMEYYDFIALKSCLKHIVPEEGPNNLCLGGIGFTTANFSN